MFPGSGVQSCPLRRQGWDSHRPQQWMQLGVARTTMGEEAGGNLRVEAEAGSGPRPSWARPAAFGPFRRTGAGLLTIRLRDA